MSSYFDFFSKGCKPQAVFVGSKSHHPVLLKIRDITLRIPIKGYVELTSYVPFHSLASAWQLEDMTVGENAVLELFTYEEVNGLGLLPLRPWVAPFEGAYK